LRRSESVGLDLADYNVETGELAIRGAKGRKDRLSYPTNGSADALKDWLVARGGDPGPLFCNINKGGRITIRRLCDQAVLHILNKRAVQASVASFSPHDLRRAIFPADPLRHGRLAGFWPSSDGPRGPGDDGFATNPVWVVNLRSAVNCAQVAWSVSRGCLTQVGPKIPETPAFEEIFPPVVHVIGEARGAGGPTGSLPDAIISSILIAQRWQIRFSACSTQIRARRSERSRSFGVD
jgi:hypothetical protein